MRHTAGLVSRSHKPSLESDMSLFLRRCLVVSALCVAAGAAVAADSAEPAAPTDALAKARTHIAAKNWPAALGELRRINQTASADWNNLMGYASRKSATPDLAAAQRHYDAALRIDPRHRGALEYSGELALIKGELATAEKRQTELERACASGCEELADLKQAIARYKANGDRYQAAP